MLRFIVAYLAVSFLTIWSSRANLPESYDLRDYGWVTEVENQGPLGTCWAFSLTTAYQSSLLKGGYVSDLNSDLLDISIWHLATRNGKNVDLSYPYNSWGGWEYVSTGYWTRGAGEWTTQGHALSIGGGSVLEASNPLNLYPLQATINHEDLTPYLPLTEQALAPIRLLRSINYYATSGTDLSSASHINHIKQMVFDHGAISTVMRVPVTSGESFDSFYNSTDYTFRYDGPLSGLQGANHAVTLIGWDDSKVVDVGGTATTGAWLLQNSWGQEWGDGGHFWISYEDVSATSANAALAVGLQGPYSPHVLQNQIFLEDIDPTLPPPPSASKVASKLVSASEGTLLALGLYAAADGQTIDLTFYDDWGAGGPTGSPLLTTQSIDLETAGYLEIPLVNPLSLNPSDPVYVVIDFGDGALEPIAVDKESLTLEGFSTFEGLSWMSEDGSTWTDLALNGTNSGIYFLKGFTAVPEPRTWTLLCLSAAYLTLRVLRRGKLSPPRTKRETTRSPARRR